MSNSALVGMFFHSDAVHRWSGQVLGEASERGWFLVTVHGDVPVMRIVSMHEMGDWQFYHTSEGHAAALESVLAQWGDRKELALKIEDLLHEMDSLVVEKEMTGDALYDLFVQWRKAKESGNS